MGMYFRKSVRVGPFRMNLSGSGIGVSTGIKGFRIGTGPRGNYIHMGRGGFYYRQQLRAGNSAPQSDPPLSLSPDPGTYAPTEIESGSVENMVDVAHAALLDELNQKLRLVNLLIPASIGLLILLWLLGAAYQAHVHWIWLTASLVLAIYAMAWVYMKNEARRTAVLLYDLDETAQAAYAQLQDGFKILHECRGKWNIFHTSKSVDTKYTAGAGTLIKRVVINTSAGNPPCIKSNILIPILPAGRQSLALLPDTILVYDGSKVGAIPYSGLITNHRKTRFVEDGSPPPDATVVDYTWQYVNKSGGPDRRFSNNRKLAVSQYDELHLISESGLNELFQFSKSGSVDYFLASLEAYQQHLQQASALNS